MKIGNELIGKEIRFSKKIDYNFRISGTPQHHVVVEMKDRWGWSKVFDQCSEKNVLNWNQVFAIRDFLMWFGQMHYTPNGVGMRDLEGSMVFNGALVKQFNDNQKD